MSDTPIYDALHDDWSNPLDDPNAERADDRPFPFPNGIGPARNHSPGDRYANYEYTGTAQPYWDSDSYEQYDWHDDGAHWERQASLILNIARESGLHGQ